MSIRSMNLASGNIGAGQATSGDGFASLTLSYSFCDVAGGCTCPPDRPAQASGAATRM